LHLEGPTTAYIRRTVGPFHVGREEFAGRHLYPQHFPPCDCYLPAKSLFWFGATPRGFTVATGKNALIFEDREVVQLLKAAIEREGNQVAFAKRHGLERSQLNAVLNGKRPVSSNIAKALGLRRAYVRDQDGGQ
jgi:hypothetical protein